jgi:hypothetical protein
MGTLASDADRRSILERLSRLRPDEPALWGRMTAPQMVCHLNDSYLTAFGEKPVSSASGLFQRTVMKWVALNMPAPWPKGIQTRPEVEQGIGGTSPTEFAADCAMLIRTIERFCVPDAALGRYAHPLFGRMSIAEWMRWGYLHADHHLRQFGA